MKLVHLRAAFGLVLVLCTSAGVAQESRAQESDPTKPENRKTAKSVASDRISGENNSTQKPAGKTRTAEKVSAGKSTARSYYFKEAEKEIQYQLYLPKNYYSTIEEDKQKTFPLIVALHGYGSNPKEIVGYPGFMRNANKHGYMIVAPMGYNRYGWYGSHGPKGGYGKMPRNIGELSEQDVLNVIEIIQNEFQVDKNRLYLYGHSMGGGGSIHLAMKFPNRWAAVAPMAPAIPWGLKHLHKAKEVPFFVVHGDNDRVLSVKKTRNLVQKMKELKIEHQYVEVEGGNHVLVAFQYWDKIFEFYNKHSLTARQARKQSTKEN